MSLEVQLKEKDKNMQDPCKDHGEDHLIIL